MPSQGEFSQHNGKSDGYRKENIHQQKGSSAVGACYIGKFPDIPSPTAEPAKAAIAPNFDLKPGLVC